MIYINFVDLYSQMLHVKFQNHRPSGSEKKRFLKIFAIYSHGNHLGHMTLTIYTNLHSLFLRMLHKSLALIGQAVSEKLFQYYGHIHVYSPGAGADNPLGPKYFHKHNSSVHLLIPSNVSAIK